MPDAPGLVRTLAELEVFAGTRSSAAVTVADPLAVRARRVRALFACSLQERSFPRAGRPEPFLGDAERRAVNAAGGIRLVAHEDQLGAERYLFYAALSRPTDLLSLSWHNADDDGAPVVRSLFVDDVLDLFGPGVEDRLERRELGAVGFVDAPTAREAARTTAAAEQSTPPDVIGPLRDGTVLGRLKERETWSASALETWAACPVKWYVERLLRPQPLVPDPEPMVRGELAHKVLEEALGALAGGAGGPLRPEHLDEARRLAVEAIARHRDAYRISPNPQRLLAALHSLEADILNYLEYAATSNSEFAPSEFELRFGGSPDEPPAVAIADGLKLQGRIDRVDRSPDGRDAVIYDYKGAMVEETLQKLGSDHVDLFLIHWPLPTRPGSDFVTRWKVLEEFRADGRARSIGVSNFEVAHLERLAAECDVVPAVNQIEIHPYFLNEEVRAYGESHGIATEAWSPIAQGGVLDDAVITEIADRVERTAAQVVLRWHVQRDSIVFPKSVTPARVRENFELFDFELTDADMEAITGLDQGEAGRTGPNPNQFTGGD